MTSPRAAPPGRPADTGFLLLPLAALVFSTAVLLGVVFGLTVLARPGCGLGDVLGYPCSEMLVRMSNFFNLIAVPGTYLFLWQSRLHRRQTRPLDRATFPAAATVVDEVLASVRLPREVAVVLGPRLGRRAFTGGTGRRPYVALGPELLMLPTKGAAGRDVFEAVLRHELAHVQNHDLLRLQFATALRISTRTAALLTAALLLALLNWSADPPAAGAAVGIVLRAGLLALAAELVTRAFLRAREHEADLRAAGGGPAGIRAALHGGVSRRAGPAERLLARHPSAAARLAGLDDGGAVLAFPVGQVLAGGVFTAVALSNAQLLVGLLHQDGVLAPLAEHDVPWVELGVLAMPAVASAVFLVRGLWRDVRGRLVSGRRPRPALVGVVFALGLLVGLPLAPYPALLYGVFPPGPPLSTVPVALGAGLVALCCWLAALAPGGPDTGEDTGEDTGGPARPAAGRGPGGGPLASALTVTVGLLLLCWLFAGWAEARAARCAVVDCAALDNPRVLLVLLGQPWAAATVALAGGTLLAAGLRRPRRRADLRRAALVAGGGVLVTLLLPRLPIAGAVTVDWSPLHPELVGGTLVVTLQAALLVAVATVAVVSRSLAGPFAAGGALLVVVVGLAARLVEITGWSTGARAEEVRWAARLFLGQAYPLALLAGAAGLAVRLLLARVRTPGRSTAGAGPAAGGGSDRAVPAGHDGAGRAGQSAGGASAG
ncbi:M48 family metalloprotease [Micromonospora sp. KLBMP9576]|uniref:M48 family metalloprotease n=1 Tax=Micromonospora sp. KLBMP9576 TaxID=3424769 RepID=UPI003D89C918